MSNAALSAFMRENPYGISVGELDAAGNIIETTRKYLGLDHGNTEMSMAEYFEQQATKTPQIIVTNAAPVEAVRPVIVHKGHVTMPRTYGDLVTQRYAERRAASERAAKQTPKP